MISIPIWLFSVLVAFAAIPALLMLYVILLGVYSAFTERICEKHYVKHLEKEIKENEEN